MSDTDGQNGQSGQSGQSGPDGPDGPGGPGGRSDADADPIAVVREFLKRINAHDAAGVVEMTTSDHLFVDALGDQLQGRLELRRAWQMYFIMVPDYRIGVDQLFVDGNAVALFGRAGGTYSYGEPGEPLRDEDAWEVPWACFATVRDGRVAAWRIFCDNEPLRAIMKRRKMERTLDRLERPLKEEAGESGG